MFVDLEKLQGTSGIQRCAMPVPTADYLRENTIVTQTDPRNGVFQFGDCRSSLLTIIRNKVFFLSDMHYFNVMFCFQFVVTFVVLTHHLPQLVTAQMTTTLFGLPFF